MRARAVRVLERASVLLARAGWPGTTLGPPPSTLAPSGGCCADGFREERDERFFLPQGQSFREEPDFPRVNGPRLDDMLGSSRKAVGESVPLTVQATGRF